MKYSFLLVALVATLGITACGKSTPPAPYSGPNKAAYDAAVESCKSKSFDNRDSCVKAAMAEVEKGKPAAPAADAAKPAAPAAPAAPAPAKK